MNLPEKEAIIPKTVRFPEWMVKYLEKQAKDSLLSISDIIRTLVLKDYEANKILNKDSKL